MKKQLFSFLFLTSAICFFANTAWATHKVEASCNANKTDIQCVKEACEGFINKCKDSIDDYNTLVQQLQTHFYPILNDKCKDDLGSLNGWLDNPTDTFAFSIKCPESPVSSETTEVFLRIDAAKLSKPNYKSPFFFMFANSKLSTPDEVEKNKITRNDECSEDFLSNPDDEDHLNLLLSKQGLKNYSSSVYDDIEYFMDDSGILMGNYDASGVDMFSAGMGLNGGLPAKIAATFFAGGSTVFAGYTNIPILYHSSKDANEVFKTIHETLRGYQCDKFYLHLIDSNFKVISVVRVGAE